MSPLFNRRTALGLVAAFTLVACGQGGTTAPPTTAGPQAQTPTENQPVEVIGEPLPMKSREAGVPDSSLGMSVPTVKGRNFVGDPVEITYPAVVVIGAHWCPHCTAAEKELVPVIKDYQGPVSFFYISTRVRQDAANYPPSQWLASWPGKAVADDEKNTANTAFGAVAVPTIVSIDKDGKVRARELGNIGAENFRRVIDLAATGT